ncbi:hypothetical protein B0H17DRAFT_1213127 [Mycena rosella]|uniref:Uncharacterized protein n=1 Tax=Mycena rosella TaxID=1033263 RepID=A0AAD7G4I3_MYCRO|nr:hypothetical protein B0H17DRAFT_1213127 [Mycena rosella]
MSSTIDILPTQCSSTRLYRAVNLVLVDNAQFARGASGVPIWQAGGGRSLRNSHNPRSSLQHQRPPQPYTSREVNTGVAVRAAHAEVSWTSFHRSQLAADLTPPRLAPLNLPLLAQLLVQPKIVPTHRRTYADPLPESVRSTGNPYTSCLPWSRCLSVSSKVAPRSLLVGSERAASAAQGANQVCTGQDGRREATWTGKRHMRGLGGRR